MSISTLSPTVNVAFFRPIIPLIAASSHARPCPELPDENFVLMGVQRVLETSVSGRGFLQEHGLRLPITPSHSNYFATLRSPRRGDLLRDLNRGLTEMANVSLSDRLKSIPELANYECFAQDGHWHQGATHDARHEGAKISVGHFYSLNLRTHTLMHLAAGQGLHEHDMSVLKRVKPKGLRQGVPKGRRVLIVYDKAGIDFAYWKRCRQECAVYFLSRVKEGMVFDWIKSEAWDRSDFRNRGVSDDQRVMTREGHLMRIVYYTDPVSGEAFEFLTNEMDLPPGVIAELYRRRWEAEKVFDQIKNKLGEKKAWGSSLETKEAQAQCVAITHNLLVLYEFRLEEEHGVKNHAEDARRAIRAAEADKKCGAAGQPLSTLVSQARRATQRSVKFVRWVRQSVRDHVTEAVAVLRLRALYATL